MFRLFVSSPSPDVCVCLCVCYNISPSLLSKVHVESDDTIIRLFSTEDDNTTRLKMCSLDIKRPYFNLHLLFKVNSVEIINKQMCTTEMKNQQYWSFATFSLGWLIPFRAWCLSNDTLLRPIVHIVTNMDHDSGLGFRCWQQLVFIT